MAKALPHCPAPVSVARRFDPLGLVEIGLGDGGIQLVRAGRADTLVLVVDVGRCIQRPLQAPRPVERCGTVETIDFAHRLGNLDPPITGHLLQDQPHGEQGCQVIRSDGLPRAGVQHRRGRRRQIGDDVVPGVRDVLLSKTVDHRFGHSTSSFLRRLPMHGRSAPQPLCRVYALSARHTSDAGGRWPARRSADGLHQDLQEQGW